MLIENDGIIIDEQDRVKIRCRNKSFWPQIYSYALQLVERDDGPGMSLDSLFRLCSGSSLERYVHRVWYAIKIKGLTRQQCYFDRNGCNRPKSVTSPFWRKVCHVEGCTTPSGSV